MKAIVLLSGGIDSTVCLAYALKKQKRDCLAMSFDYGQKHKIELKAAKAIAKYYNVPIHIIPLSIDFLFSSSSLLSTQKIVPSNRTVEEILAPQIPSTYVPARNTIFLSLALGMAEAIKAKEIYYGPNALDIDNYPDCHPKYIKAFQNLINTAMHLLNQENIPQVIAPFTNYSKEEIIDLGISLEVPLHLTHSCYSPQQGKPCHQCDACILRDEAIKKSLQKKTTY